MKTTAQIKVDRWVWRPIAGIVDAFARKGAAPPLGEVRTIVVCKFKGLGNIVQATPLLAALRERFPRSRIVFVSTQANQELLEMLPQLDEIICVQEGSWQTLRRSLSAATQRIRYLRPEVFLNLEVYAHYASLFAWRSRAAVRVGFVLPGDSPRRGLYTHQHLYDPDVPLSGRFHALLGSLVADAGQEGPLYPFPDVAAPRTAHDPVLLINPNVSAGGLVRRWPGDRFAALAVQWLLANPQGRVVVTGAATEQGHVLGIVRQADDARVTPLTGQTLAGLMQTLGQATVFVTNDSGPMHLAFALGVPTVALFGPVGPWKYHLPRPSVAVFHPVHCSPCLSKALLPACDGDNICMQAIQVGPVLEAVLKIQREALGMASPE